MEYFKPTGKNFQISEPLLGCKHAKMFFWENQIELTRVFFQVTVILVTTLCNITYVVDFMMVTDLRSW